MIDAAQELIALEPVTDVCEALGVDRTTLYRSLLPENECSADNSKREPRTSIRSLSSSERENVLELLHSERFVDCPPPQVYANLLDEGAYHCSISTMYRLLKDNSEVRERRNQLTHPAYTKHELLAEGPNELWSWDITKLRGEHKWTYYYLYVIMDVFSRYVVGWCVTHTEDACLAKQLIKETCQREKITEGQLTIHADRGSAMTSKNVAFLLADLGVTKTHSRPHVSNDNPYSEAHFKTLKYRPDFPKQFGSLEDARLFCQGFFRWYNHQHRHSGIALMTPAVVHTGQSTVVNARRADVLTAAYAANPERFVNKIPTPLEIPRAVWINKPAENDQAEGGLENNTN